MTDSAVSMADSADTAVRAISTAIATPVEKVTGLAAGITHGFSQFRKSKSFADATTAAKEAAREREADLREDLRTAGRTPMDTERPEVAASSRGRAHSPLRGPGPRRYRNRIPCPSRPTSRLPRSGTARSTHRLGGVGVSHVPPHGLPWGLGGLIRDRAHRRGMA